MMRAVKLSQHREVPFQQLVRSFYSLRYGYVRSVEGRMNEDVGQDYLTFREEENTVLFAVCDGVSLSYFGDFAARFVGDQLILWLEALQGQEDEKQLTKQLAQFLSEKAQEADQLLEYDNRPEAVSGVLREVLTLKKKEGSGAMFACGRIDFPNVQFPQGRLLLSWMGDLRIRLWQGQNELSSCLGAHFQPWYQWNSKKGLVGGIPNVYQQALIGTDTSKGSLLIYSDGLKVLDETSSVTCEIIQDSIFQQSQNPSSDDLSFFQVEWDASRLLQD